MSEHVLVSKKPRSATEDRRNLARHILPAFGRRLITEITSADLAKFQASKSAMPIAANRCLALMSHMFNMAERWGFRPPRSNPCEHVAKYPERAREKMLSPEELARLGSALATATAGYPHGAGLERTLGRRRSPEDWRAIAFVRLLIFTGARLSEVLGLRWDQLDLRRGIAGLSKSRPAQRQFICQSPPLRSCWQSRGSTIRRSCSLATATGHTTQAPRRPGSAFERFAGLPDVRLHDLRHTHASEAVSAGESLYIVEKFWVTPTPAQLNDTRI